MISMLFTMLPGMALAEESGQPASATTVTVYDKELNSQNPYAIVMNGNNIDTTTATAENYNLYWNADQQELTMRNLDFTGSATGTTGSAIIFSNADNFTINVCGENTITVENDEPDEFFGISNPTGSISIKNGTEETNTLSIAYTQSQKGSTICDNAAISAARSFSNDTKLDLKVSVADGINYSGNLAGIQCNMYESKAVSGTFFNNESGDISIAVSNMGKDVWYGADVYGIFLWAEGFYNGGNINITTNLSNGSTYGLRGSDTKAVWVNDGTLNANVTAYGGAIDGYEGSYKDSNHASAISIVSTGNDAVVDVTNNGTLSAVATNWGKNGRHEYAIGIELDGKNDVKLNNTGILDAKGFEAYSYGINLMCYTGDSILTNAGIMDVTSTTTGHDLYDGSYALATGIGLNLNYATEQQKTKLDLKDGSTLSVTAEPSPTLTDEEKASVEPACQAIWLQKIYNADPAYTELPQEILLEDNLVVLEGGTPFTHFFDDLVEYGMWAYGNSMGYEKDADGNIIPARTVKIVSQKELTGTVVITGTAQAGQTLTAAITGLPEAVTVTYQWQVADKADGTFTDIADATNATYVLTENEVGKYLRVVATTDDVLYTGTLSATTEAPIAAKPIKPVEPPVDPPKPSGGSSSGGFSGIYNYPVKIDDTDNATVKLDKNYAVEGDTVVITVTPDAGKKVAEVIVTNENDKMISVSKVGDNKYSFIMPKGKVNVSVVTSNVDYDSHIILQINNRNICLNNRTITNDVAPVIVDNRTMVPIRVVTETLGGKADWNASTRTVTLTIDGKVLKMTINEKILGFDAAPVIINNRTYVPIRYVAEKLGANVEWIAETQQIIIEK